MIYFLSDAHLGSRILPDKQASHKQERKVCAMLRTLAKDATEIFLLGDMIDFWFEYAYTVPKGQTRFLGTLAEIADSGIVVHYFTGNHDMWTYGYLQEECGVIVHKKPESIEINGKKCFLAHGDGLKETNTGVKIIQWIFHSEVCKKLFCLIPSRFGINFGLWWSAKNRTKELQWHNRYCGENSERLVLFAKDAEKVEHHDYYIFGHRHILLDLMIKKDSRVIILGDCINEFSYAAIDDNGDISLLHFDEESLL